VDAAMPITRAIPLFEATLTDCRRVLSEGHPMTATVAESLHSARDALNT
jgi:hypothetical protein